MTVPVIRAKVVNIAATKSILPKWQAESYAKKVKLGNMLLGADRFRRGRQGLIEIVDRYHVMVQLKVIANDDNFYAEDEGFALAA